MCVCVCVCVGVICHISPVHIVVHYIQIHSTYMYMSTSVCAYMECFDLCDLVNIVCNLCTCTHKCVHCQRGGWHCKVGLGY